MTKVWAPAAKSLELIIGQKSSPMQRDAAGWWSANGLRLEHGTDYRFRVDGELLPDPRSPWQPDGVHGTSRHVDHDRFAWTDQAFQARPLSSAIVYELHVGTFTPQATFDAVIE